MCTSTARLYRRIQAEAKKLRRHMELSTGSVCETSVREILEDIYPPSVVEAALGAE